MKKRIAAIRERTDTMTVPPGHAIDQATRDFLMSVGSDIGWLIYHLEGKTAAVEVLADEIRDLQEQLDKNG